MLNLSELSRSRRREPLSRSGPILAAPLPNPTVRAGAAAAPTVFSDWKSDKQLDN